MHLWWWMNSIDSMEILEIKLKLCFTNDSANRKSYPFSGRYNGLDNILFILQLSMLYNTILIFMVPQYILFEFVFGRKFRIIKSSLKCTWNHFGTSSIQAIVSTNESYFLWEYVIFYVVCLSVQSIKTIAASWLAFYKMIWP